MKHRSRLPHGGMAGFGSQGGRQEPDVGRGEGDGLQVGHGRIAAAQEVGKALFGPVITPAPKGEAAGELWDGLVLVSKADGFFELKRSRDRKPTFD